MPIFTLSTTCQHCSRRNSVAFEAPDKPAFQTPVRYVCVQCNKESTMYTVNVSDAYVVGKVEK